MRLSSKLFFVSVLSAIVLFSETACTQENKNPGRPATIQSKEATASPKPPLLMNILLSVVENVSEATKGNAVDFTFKLDGKEVSFKEYTKDKVVFLNFWGTWCGPCRREIPDIIEVFQDLKNKDFVVVGIPQERDPATAQEKMDKVKAFAEANGIPYLNVVDAKRTLGASYGGINAVPTTFIIDKKGKIAESIVGGQNKEAFMHSINRVLK